MRYPLLRLAVAVFALGLVSLGGMYAAFTDTDADSGTVTAGNIIIRLNTLKGVDEVTWSGVGCVSDNMAPGDVCEADVFVRNDGNLALTYTVEDLSTECFTVTHTGPVDTNGAGGTTPGAMPAGAPADIEKIDASVVVGDNNACQGVTASVGIKVNAESS